MKTRTPWQRMALSLIGILIIAGMWKWSVNHLYSLDPAAFSAFVSLTTNASYVIGAIVIFMVTGRLVYEWKNQTVSSVQNIAETIREDRFEKLTQDYAEKYKDDPSYAPIPK